jgi:alpha-glucosidase (family GH31 glycosyl hydrolase)
MSHPSDGLILLQVQSIKFLSYNYPISICFPIYTLYNLSLSYTHVQNGYLYGSGEHHYAHNLTLSYHTFHLPFTFSSTVPVNGDITIPWYIHTSGFGILWNQAGYGSFDVVGHPNPLPHFTSGFWQCKNRDRSQQELLDVAKLATTKVLRIVFLIENIEFLIETNLYRYI